MLLEITPAERDELLQVVESTLSEMRIEVRRTRTTGFRQRLKAEENVLEGLLDKLRHVGDETV